MAPLSLSQHVLQSIYSFQRRTLLSWNIVFGSGVVFTKHANIDVNIAYTYYSVPGILKKGGRMVF
jgi:hypothetical protein